MGDLLAEHGSGMLAGGFLILLGVLVRFFPILIAGYNTMSAEQKKNVDVKGLTRFACLCFVVLGAGWIVFPVVIYLLGNEKWIQTFYWLWLPAGIIFMFIKSQKYDHNQ